MWLWSTLSVAGATGELILINVNGHMWLMATIAGTWPLEVAIKILQK